MRAYVLINASAGKAIEVARSLQGVKGIELADAITGEYDVIAAVEAPDVAGIGSGIVEKIQKIDGGFKTVTRLAVRLRRGAEGRSTGLWGSRGGAAALGAAGLGPAGGCAR